MKAIILSAFLILSVMIFSPAMATELSGTVYSKGAPVANLTIAVKGSDTKTKTGPKGEYKLDLAPGDYTLIIRGKEFPIKVASAPTRHDIQL